MCLRRLHCPVYMVLLTPDINDILLFVYVKPFSYQACTPCACVCHFHRHLAPVQTNRDRLLGKPEAPFYPPGCIPESSRILHRLLLEVEISEELLQAKPPPTTTLDDREFNPRLSEWSTQDACDWLEKTGFCGKSGLQAAIENA